MKRRYIFRLIALSISTVSGILFLGSVWVLIRIYSQFGYLPLFALRRGNLIETGVLGVVFACSLPLYLRLVSQKRSTG
jgi:hypothetical protein